MQARSRQPAAGFGCRSNVVTRRSVAQVVRASLAASATTTTLWYARANGPQSQAPIALSAAASDGVVPEYRGCEARAGTC